MRVAMPCLLAALVAPPAALASEQLPSGPSAGWGLSDTWRDSIARALGAGRSGAESTAPDLSAFAPLEPDDDEDRRVRVRASSSLFPRVFVTMPAWTSNDGQGGVDLTGLARRPRTGLHASGIPDRTLWSAAIEAWRDAGPFTAYAGAGTGRSSDLVDSGRAERSTYAGIELAGAGGTWRLETGRLRGDPVLGTERDTRLSWRQRVAAGWSLGIEASRVSAPGWSDRTALVSVRGSL